MECNGPDYVPIFDDTGAFEQHIDVPEGLFQKCFIF